MALESVTTWHRMLRPRLPGIEAAFLNDEIVYVARDFCERTYAWREPLTPAASVAGQGGYALATPTAGVEIVRIEDLFFEGRKLTPASPDDLAQNFGDRDWRSVKGTPLHYHHDVTRDEAVITPAPEAVIAGALTGTVSVMPALESTMVPDFLRRKYDEEMRMGVWGRLMMMKNVPWSREQEGLLLFGRYESLRGTAKAMAWRGNARSRSRVKPFYM